MGCMVWYSTATLSGEVRNSKSPSTSRGAIFLHQFQHA